MVRSGNGLIPSNSWAQTWQKAKTDTFPALFVCGPCAYGINRCTPWAILSNCPPLLHPCGWRHTVCVVRAGKREETEKWILENGTNTKLEIMGTKHQYWQSPPVFSSWEGKRKGYLGSGNLGDWQSGAVVFNLPSVVTLLLWPPQT